MDITEMNKFIRAGKKFYTFENGAIREIVFEEFLLTNVMPGVSSGYRNNDCRIARIRARIAGIPDLKTYDSMSLLPQVYCDVVACAEKGSAKRLTFERMRECAFQIVAEAGWIVNYDDSGPVCYVWNGETSVRKPLFVEINVLDGTVTPVGYGTENKKANGYYKTKEACECANAPVVYEFSVDGKVISYKLKVEV